MLLNYEKVLKLRVTKEQENFVASNDYSLIHAFLALSDGDPVYAFAIYKGKTVIGFIQIGYDDDWTGEEYEEWLQSDEYKKIVVAFLFFGIFGMPDSLLFNFVVILNSLDFWFVKNISGRILVS